LGGDADIACTEMHFALHEVQASCYAAHGVDLLLLLLPAVLLQRCSALLAYALTFASAAYAASHTASTLQPTSS
jgi:hypothetical protein